MSLDSYSEYLRFDASDIQTLLRRKLTESGIMTDQLYPGSDLKIIIDLFAWTFNVMAYMLNNAAADALFSDTVLYENMNRLVKILSYNPIGYRTAQCQFKIGLNTSNLTKLLPQTINIPRFASLDIGKTDQYGNNIYYTFLDNYTLSVYTYLDDKGKVNGYVITPQSWPTLYNGEIKKYADSFYSVGIIDQSFELSMLDATNTSNPDYCDFNSFYIFVQTVNTDTGQSQYEEWKQVNNLVLNAGPDDKYYELRLNENKKYTLYFGNNIHGAVPPNGAVIHILYLKSNGEQGKLDSGQVNLSELRLSIYGFSDPFEMIDMLYHGLPSFKQNYGSLFINNSVFANSSEKLTFSNIDESSTPTTFETVDQIRQHAPTAFRSGQRLITNYDFENYILNNFANLVKHVYVNNNTYYISTFYRWLNKYNALNINIRKYYYKFADACDFNNVYIWLKSVNTLTQLNMNKIITSCNPYKSLTTELVPLEGVDTYFVPFVQHSNDEYKYNVDSKLSSFDEYLQNRIKIIVYKNTVSLVSDEQLKEKINNIILNYFDISNQKFGSIINLSEITQEIYNTGYVKTIKTVNIPLEDSNNVEYVVGLSFALFTKKFIDYKDFEVFTGSITLENFQFPSLYMSSLLSMIEIRDDTHNLTNIEF